MKRHGPPSTIPLFGIFNPVLNDTVIGGVPVIDIKPKGWTDNGKVLIYSHGGAYVLFSARSTLMGSVPVADRLSIRVISIDYTNPPVARSCRDTGPDYFSG